MAELVRTMLDLIVSDPTIEQQQEAVSSLLMILLEAVNSGKLEQDRVVKLIERVNFTIF